MLSVAVSNKSSAAAEIGDPGHYRHEPKRGGGATVAQKPSKSFHVGLPGMPMLWQAKSVKLSKHNVHYSRPN